jgi:PAS domain S-box-containing protein
VANEATIATAAEPEAVEELLHQLVQARFVLTDGTGCVTRWSRPAEQLLGWPATAMAGRGLLETLAVPGAMPETGGQMEVAARRKDGSELELALTFVPVSMSQSLEFNGFLEALELVGARESALARLQQSHRTVVDWIAAGVAGHATFQNDQPAGTIVTFRALGDAPPPSVAEDPTASVAAHPPAVPLEELESIRAGAAAADERIAELEEAGGRLEALVSDARAALDAMVDQVAELRRELDQSREESRRAAESGSSREELAATDERLDRLEAALAETRRGEEDGSRRLEEATARQELLAGTVEEQLARAESLAAKAESTFASGEELAAGAERRSEETAAAAAEAVAQSQAAREAAEQLVERAEAAAAAAEQAAVEAREAEPAAAGVEGFGELLSVAEADGDGRRPLVARRSAEPQREPRPGFDDADHPIARISVDGHFEELNPAFSELVGYSEQDFKAATWPPVTDRANLEKHREQVRLMLAGETGSVEVDTGYVHAQGLLVPVVGSLVLVRESGEPSHFLLELRAP